MIREALDDEGEEEENATERKVDSTFKLVADIARESDNLLIHNMTKYGGKNDNENGLLKSRFSPFPRSSPQRLDKTILLRLLDDDSKVGGRKPGKLLEVAIKWRRPDMARKILRESESRTRFLTIQRFSTHGSRPQKWLAKHF